jgi:uncharacterized membrane protein YagU involved in acid resistance
MSAPAVSNRAVDSLLSAVAGFVATVPMTIFMVLLHRRLPEEEQYPLPPREITMKAADEAGVIDHLSPEARSAATLITHFGFGAAAGALYGAVADSIPLPSRLKAVLFGLGVWSVSYLGIFPALGVLTPATEHPPRRNALMIAAHVVWGLALGTLAKLLIVETRQDAQQAFGTTTRPHRDVAHR